MFYALDFPNISPEIFTIRFGEIAIPIYWYALAYIVGITVGYYLIRAAIGREKLWRAAPPMDRAQLEDLLTWMVVGIIVGGRLGFTLFYQPGYYLTHPLEIITGIRDGGMSFHGGFLGVVLAAFWFARKHSIPVASLADLLAMAAPIGLGLVRITNFINAELWGRPTLAPWGVIFPGAAAQDCPGFEGPCARHPSQLYEALLEGLLLAAVLITLSFAFKWLRHPGRIAGLFFLGYGLSRFVVEFFRQADAQFITPDNPVGAVFMGMTMGQLLSTPMIVAGVLTLFWSVKKGPARA